MDIRAIEREVVDQHHRSLRVWQRPQSAIIWGVLRHLGQAAREFQQPGVSNAPLVSLWRVFDEFKRGAAQAVRWAAESDAVEYDWLPENEQVLDETMELLDWGANYARLAASFIAWTRKVVSAEVDTTECRVRFAFNRDVAASLTAADLNEAKQAYHVFVSPLQAVRELLALDNEEDWLAVDQWPSERPKLNRHPAFAEVAKWARQVLMPELEDATLIGPLYLSELRRFWATIWLVSASYAIYEDDLDERTAYKNDLPSAVLCMTKDQWIHKLGVAVGLYRERVAMLLELFTFDPGTLHSSITSHPFVATRSGLLLLCPRLIYHHDPRNLVGWILNARPELRGVYGDLNHRLQHLWIKKLGDAFRAGGWTCWTEHRFRSRDTEITPDIVARDRNHQVIVADFKHTTPPIEPRQFSDRLKSFDASCEQVCRYHTVFREHPEMLGSLGIDHHPEVVRIALIYRWALTIPYAVSPEVVVLHAERILRDLKSGATTLTQLLTSPIAGSSPRIASREIQVAEWTFELPVLELDDWDSRKAK